MVSAGKKALNDFRRSTISQNQFIITINPIKHKMEHFAEVSNVNYFVKRSILDVWEGILNTPRPMFNIISLVSSIPKQFLQKENEGGVG